MRIESNHSTLRKKTWDKGNEEQWIKSPRTQKTTATSYTIGSWSRYGDWVVSLCTTVEDMVQGIMKPMMRVRHAISYSWGQHGVQMIHGMGNRSETGTSFCGTLMTVRCVGVRTIVTDMKHYMVLLRMWDGNWPMTNRSYGGCTMYHKAEIQRETVLYPKNIITWGPLQSPLFWPA